jgi:aryl-alcohol dehydrogenase-like predicted oxidoreductase
VHVHVHGMRTARARPLQAWSPLGSGLLTRYLRDAPEAKQACVEVEP